MKTRASPVITREVLYIAMCVLLGAIFLAAYWRAPPVYIAVGFIAEITLVSTAHLSCVIQQYGVNLPPGREAP